MQITPVDSENNLFRVENVFSADLAERVLATDWVNVPWQRQEGQETWNRRRLNNASLPWITEWDMQLSQSWSSVEKQVGVKIAPYFGTAFWLDEHDFTCTMHTDGELPGSLHLTWVGAGTTFYWYKDPATVRYQVPAMPNAGYIMINQPDTTGYRKLLWHAMLEPVQNFRVTSYTWITPI